MAMAQLVGLGVLIAQQAAAGPAFSWDTVPVFQQLCDVNGTLSAEIPEEKLQWLTRWFPLVTIEHCQGQGSESYSGDVLRHGFIEDHMLALAAQIKAVNRSTAVLYYNNVDAALPFFRLARPLFEGHSDWALQGKVSHGGHMFPNVSGLVYDQSIPEVRDLWMQHFANMTKPSSALDGIFIDVGGTINNVTTTEALFGAMQRANPDKIVGHVTGLASRVPYKLKQTYTFAASEAEIRDLIACSSEDGTLCEAHYQPSFESFEGKPHDNPTGWNATLAAFLIGANEGSYFGFSTKTPQLGEYFCGGPYPTWATGMGWSEDYTRPLGPPDGPAHRSADGVYTRSFGSNATRVMLQVKNKGGALCDISWGDGHRTTCTDVAPAPPSPGPPIGMCAFEQETDYGDANRRQFRVSGSGHAPRTACCDACANDSECAVAVMDKRNHTAEGIMCTLKATATKKIRTQLGRVSCIPRKRLDSREGGLG